MIKKLMKGLWRGIVAVYRGLWRFFHYCRWHMAHTILCGVAVALFIRLTVKDDFPIVAALYYATPLIVCAAATLVATILHASHRRWKPALIASILTILLAAAWGRMHWVNMPSTPQRGDVRIMFWNVARVTEDFNGLAEAIAVHDPHIMALTESAGLREKPESFLKTYFPGYHVQRMDGGVTLLAKGTINAGAYVELGTFTGMARFAVDLDSGPQVDIVVTDFISWPAVHRQPFVEAVYQAATAPGSPHAIIVGDFNTPHDSIHFDVLAEDFEHAFITGGSGLITTWPAVCPVLALDHIWVPRQYRVLRSWLRRTPSSDHKLVIADLELRDTNE